MRRILTPRTGTPTSGMSLLGGAALVAVVALLILVSVPRLRRFALNENEADARSIARLIAGEIADLAPDPEKSAPSIESLTTRDEVSRALSDTAYLFEGHLLRRHGYLFCVVSLRTEASAPGLPPSLLGSESAEVLAAEGEPDFAILAWPWERGRTGSSALLATPNRGVFLNENPSGTWNGPGDHFATPFSSWDGWHRLPQ